MKTALTILFLGLFSSLLYASTDCYEVSYASDEYPDPRPQDIDQVCISDNLNFKFFKKKKVIETFQPEVEIRNKGYRCWNTGRAHSSRCYYSNGEKFLLYFDHGFEFEIKKVRGAKTFYFNEREYIFFWVF